MLSTEPKKNSLVLYKQKPALVQQVGAKKLTIEVAGSGTSSVRPKDVLLLHPGPLTDLAQLVPLSGEVVTAWELLQGETANLHELAELAYDEYSVRTAWAAWLLVADGLYFSGTPENIVVRTAEEVQAEQANRLAKEAEQQAWDDFLQRAAAGETAPEDARYHPGRHRPGP